METKKSGFWWMRTPQKETKEPLVPKLDLQGLHPSASLTDILQKESPFIDTDSDVDVGSIIEEINRVAAQSPLGPFEKSIGDRSIDDIMKEAEKVYMESSRSFEQLSQRSKTSQNISELLTSNSKMSTPTPRSVSPLPMDTGDGKSAYSSDYSEDFSQESKAKSGIPPKYSPKLQKMYKDLEEIEISEGKYKTISKSLDRPKSSDASNSLSKTAKSISLVKNSFQLPLNVPSRSNSITPKHSPLQSLQESPYMSPRESPVKNPTGSGNPLLIPKSAEVGHQEENEISISKLPEKPQFLEPYNLGQDNRKIEELGQELEIRNKLVRTLEENNSILKSEIQAMMLDLEKTHALVEKLKSELNAKTLSSPAINLELEKALEELKDTKEINTSLQLQLDTVNKTHQLLKSSYDDLLSSNKNHERKVVELDSALTKYKTELLNVQQAKNKLLENEINLNKLLEIEKLQSKSLKLQNEKDSRCIQDLNRQIKEMERIIARKHPDSVSALIVAAKEDAADTNLTARKLLEDRIKILEQEVSNRDAQSSKVFLEIQEKFNQMKNKYESHIEDLELHVNDLKNQLKRKIDTYDVYTQTFLDEKIPQKETFTVAVQTEVVVNKPKIVQSVPVKKVILERDNHKEDAHLIATIRGLQADLANKEKVIVKLQKEIDEARKTNRRLQKEREGSLKNLSERKDFRSYPEKLASHSRSESVQDFRRDEELQQVKLEKGRLKQQLARLEGDYQTLKKKRLDDLTALQEAHEREVANYVTSVTPLREQLELQQVSISTLQSQLSKAKEELAVVTVERDHLNNRLLSSLQCGTLCKDGVGDGRERTEVDDLLKKIAFLEKSYEEREYRLRAIVHSLAQKTVTNRSCEQCAERQQQLIGYKVELDQLMATVRALK